MRVISCSCMRTNTLYLVLTLRRLEGPKSRHRINAYARVSKELLAKVQEAVVSDDFERLRVSERECAQTDALTLRLCSKCNKHVAKRQALLSRSNGNWRHSPSCATKKHNCLRQNAPNYVPPLNTWKIVGHSCKRNSTRPLVNSTATNSSL